ncbi:cryptochrome/photolyase family protein [Cellulomonas endophytica]|uniref:cryptochrome/photolyase family protein n=1 Tax=Cellulomonas endophytica TaxID=2494735 RepID=UPI0010116AD9|nr:deoxyribodipyrimidine photo-lyase [Cellulomonas endophytica]
MPTVLWFRRDLRLSDHPALVAAVTQARADDDEVLALYVTDPVLWRVAGPPRLAYLAATLEALDEALGGRLVVRHGDPVEVVPAVAREVGARHVHVTAATEPFGRRRDEAVAAALARAGAELVPTGSPYAVAPGRLATGAGEEFKVFTPFRRAWLAHGWHAPAPRPRSVPWAALASQGVPRPPAGDVRLPPAGEAAHRARWHRFLEGGLAGYADRRDRPDLEGTSSMSIPLKWGELHPRTLLADLAAVPVGGRGEPAREDVDGYRSELAWREFHADVLWHRPGSRTRSLRDVVPEDAWDSGPDADARFDAWAEGRTGYPLVDAGMRQMRTVGWMHNRVRMVTASFLVKDLHLPWQRGAALFMERLVDGDVPQNQLNWQWVAGTGRDAAPYFRVFNPVVQGEKFDPDGDYVRRWVPELREVSGRAVHRPWDLGLVAPEGYPAPVVDHARERERALADHARARA